MPGRKPSLASLKVKAWNVLSRHVRQSAANSHGVVECYTCGANDDWKWMQAGHAIPGRHGAVLFDLEIIRPQCYRCNVPMRGMHHVFAHKLMNEYEVYHPGLSGIAWWDQKLFKARKEKKWDRSDLEELIAKYSK